MTSALGDSESVVAAPFESAGMLAVAIACWIGIRRYGVLDVRVILAGRALPGADRGRSRGLPGCRGRRGHRRRAAAGPVGAAVALLVALPLRETLQRQVNRVVFGDGDDPGRAIGGAAPG